MKRLIKTLVLLITGLAIGVVIGRVSKNKTYTITNLDDEVLVDIGKKDIITHESIKVYVNDKLA